MYEALHKKPDLIVLDDPISSFDKSKKYAIMHMLFRGKSADCLLNKTVLMLTHDLDQLLIQLRFLKNSIICQLPVLFQLKMEYCQSLK